MTLKKIKDSVKDLTLKEKSDLYLFLEGAIFEDRVTEIRSKLNGNEHITLNNYLNNLVSIAGDVALDFDDAINVSLNFQSLLINGYDEKTWAIFEESVNEYIYAQTN